MIAFMHDGRGAGVFRVFGFPVAAWALGQGIYWIGCGRCRVSLRTPNYRLTFTEREGLAKHIRIGLWRLRFFRVRA